MLATEIADDRGERARIAAHDGRARNGSVANQHPILHADHCAPQSRAPSPI